MQSYIPTLKVNKTCNKVNEVYIKFNTHEVIYRSSLTAKPVQRTK